MSWHDYEPYDDDEVDQMLGDPRHNYAEGRLLATIHRMRKNYEHLMDRDNAAIVELARQRDEALSSRISSAQARIVSAARNCCRKWLKWWS